MRELRRWVGVDTGLDETTSFSPARLRLSFELDEALRKCCCRRAAEEGDASADAPVVGISEPGVVSGETMVGEALSAEEEKGEPAANRDIWYPTVKVPAEGCESADADTLARLLKDELVARDCLRVNGGGAGWVPEGEPEGPCGGVRSTGSPS